MYDTCLYTTWKVLIAGKIYTIIGAIAVTFAIRELFLLRQKLFNQASGIELRHFAIFKRF